MVIDLSSPSNKAERNFIVREVFRPAFELRFPRDRSPSVINISRMGPVGVGIHLIHSGDLEASELKTSSRWPFSLRAVPAVQ